MRLSLVPLVFLLAFVPSTSAATHKTPRLMTGTAAKGAVSPKLQVVTDLDQRLAKFRAVPMPFHSAGLSPREQKLVSKLMEACQSLESIYWRQSDPEGLALYQSLGSSQHAADKKLRRYLRINGSRFDLVDEDNPFVGTEAAPPGRALYPKDVTQAKIDAFLKEHPDKRSEIYNPLTVVRWHGDVLEGLPYHIAYRAFLEPAAKSLREAAAFSNDPAFAKFLSLRADALLSDDYFESDLAWLDLKNPKFDIIFAPYETYLDGLLGVKGSYGAAVMIRNEEQSKKLELFEKYESDIQDALPLAAEDRPSKRGFQTPMEVMDTPFRAGDLRHGYQAVADNLPNDPRIHEKKGSKKLFFKNFIDARVEFVVLPIARKLMSADQSGKASAEGYMMDTIMHEICHGLGPAFSRTPTGQKDIREAIGPAFGGLEEAKADVVGLYGLHWLVEHNALPKERLEEYYASYLAGIFRTVRFGTVEAHGRAEMMEFNYLSEHLAIQRDASGRYAIGFAKIPDAVASLAKELLEIEATGDRARAEAWFAKYGTMPAELQAALKSASDVPVDVDPVSSLPEPMR